MNDFRRFGKIFPIIITIAWLTFLMITPSTAPAAFNPDRCIATGRDILSFPVWISYIWIVGVFVGCGIAFIGFEKRNFWVFTDGLALVGVIAILDPALLLIAQWVVGGAV